MQYRIWERPNIPQEHQPWLWNQTLLPYLESSRRKRSPGNSALLANNLSTLRLHDIFDILNQPQPLDFIYVPTVSKTSGL